MDARYKLREISDRFSNLDNIMSVEGRDKRYGQMRLLSQREFFHPTSSDISRGKVAYYGIEAVCQARLCLALYDAGFDTATIRILDIAFHPPFEGEQGRGLANVIAGIRAGEDWVFEVTRNRDDQGNLGASGYFRPEDAPSVQSQHRKELRNHNKAQGRVRVLTVVLYATDLLKPLLTA